MERVGSKADGSGPDRKGSPKTRREGGLWRGSWWISGIVRKGHIQDVPPRHVDPVRRGNVLNGKDRGACGNQQRSRRVGDRPPRDEGGRLAEELGFHNSLPDRGENGPLFSPVALGESSVDPSLDEMQRRT